MSLSETQHGTKGRRLIRPNLEAIERRQVTDTAKVTVMLSRSERASIFDRVLMKGISTPEAEAKNFDVPRPLIMHTLHMEVREFGRRKAEEGYVAGKRAALMPDPPTASWRLAA
jgi:hypothetical protein